LGSDVNINFVPHNFTIQILDPAANGGNPRPGYNADWTTVSTKTSVGQTIFDAGVWGVEYTFTAVDARGIRLSGMQAYVTTGKVQVAELLAFTNIQSGDAIELVDANLRLKTDSAASYVQHELDDVASTTDLNDMIDPLNQALRGYQMEALVSTFGQLWLRGTVAGDNSELWIDDEGVEGAATELGLPTTETEMLGVTEPITKAPTDAMTIIYRVNLTGNVPGGYPE
jgi:hypothetical protein